MIKRVILVLAMFAAMILIDYWLSFATYIVVGLVISFTIGLVSVVVGAYKGTHDITNTATNLALIVAFGTLLTYFSWFYHLTGGLMTILWGFFFIYILIFFVGLVPTKKKAKKDEEKDIIDEILDK